MSDEQVFDDDDDDEFLAVINSEEVSQSSSTGLSDSQKARAEKNRLKALALKKARLTSRPYPEVKSTTVHPIDGGVFDKPAQQETKLVDTKAGFFIEEDPTEPQPGEIEVERDPAPFIEPDRPTCLECRDDLADSFLYRTFDHEVCDKCKDTEKDGKHELITRTDIKNEFLLKDHDLDQRAPPLKFILRKNPHNPRWGDMKLYLRLQVEKRALEVWGTEEALENEHEKKEERRDQAKSKKFAKKLKILRMQVRGSLFKKDVGVGSGHVHQYGDETYNEESDEYSKTCKTCGHINTYEKM